MDATATFVKRVMSSLVFGVGLALVSVSAAKAQVRSASNLRVVTPRGAELEVIVSRPVGKGPFPVVVLGSGSSYTMQQPILERVARSLVKSGVGVYRFNWAYHVRDPAHGKQSADRQDELEDMRTVLELARSATWTDPERIFLGGKSLGSIIAWQLFRREPNVAGALLLTPVCSRASEPAFTPGVNYPDLAVEQRPVQWILGDEDPVCEPRTLYQFLAHAPRAQRVALLQGNHGFSHGSTPEQTPSVATRRVIELAADLASHFVTTVSAEPPVEPQKP